MMGDPYRRLESRQAAQFALGIAEVELLLQAWQAAELERLARTRHQTVAQLLRALVRDFLEREAGGGAGTGPEAVEEAVLAAWAPPASRHENSVRDLGSTS
jgi:hypothetical protein